MRFRLRSPSVLRWLVLIAACLVVAHVATRLLGSPDDDDYLLGVGPFFDLDAEANLPTFYSTFTLLLAAAILAGLGSLESDDRSRRPYWLGLAAIFCFLAIDEATQLHELVGGLIESRIRTTGYLYYSWIVPYAALLGALAVLYGRFLLRLPPRTRWLIVVAGLAYAAGVLGLEAMAARHDEIHGQDNRTFTLLATIEEMLEMGAVALFVYALLAYAEREHGGLEIEIGARGRGDQRP